MLGKVTGKVDRGGSVKVEGKIGREGWSYHKYKVLKVPPQNGRFRSEAESGHEGPLSMHVFGSSAVSAKGYTDKGNSLSMHPSEPTPLSAHPVDKKA